MPANVTWGKPIPTDPYVPLDPESDGLPPDLELSLHRRGQTCRWYDADGNQFGPEQTNIGPALAWAAQQGLYERGNVISMAVIGEVRSAGRREPSPRRAPQTRPVQQRPQPEQGAGLFELG